jgi:hypothetical protein
VEKGVDDSLKNVYWQFANPNWFRGSVGKTIFVSGYRSELIRASNMPDNNAILVYMGDVSVVVVVGAIQYFDT